MKAKGPANDYPMVVEVGLVGSCTNSSYQDLARAASVARQAYEKGIEVKGQLIINPGSEQIRYTAERDGILDDFKKIGALIMPTPAVLASDNGSVILTTIHVRTPSSLHSTETSAAVLTATPILTPSSAAQS